MRQWIDAKGPCRWIAVTGNACGDGGAGRCRLPKHVKGGGTSGCPDGMSLVWLGPMRGRRLQRRCTGRNLIEILRHPLPPATTFPARRRAGVAESLAAFARRYPSAHIVGTIYPAFRSAECRGRDDVVAQIDAGGAGCGLGGTVHAQSKSSGCSGSEQTPRSSSCGVGAAFDFISGRVRQAATGCAMPA